MLDLTDLALTWLLVLWLVAVQAVDELSMVALVIVSFVLRSAGAQFVRCARSTAATMVSTLFFLAYFIYRFSISPDDPSQLLEALVRSVCARQLVWGTMILVTAAARTTCDYFHYGIQQAIVTLRRTFASPLQTVARLPHLFRKKAVASEPVPVPSKAAQMGITARQATEDFNAQVSIFETLPLDDDEREVLLMEAKQRLLLKLSDLARSADPHVSQGQ